ncbi:MAG: hypothetical protein V3R73_03715, partial [Sphingomonadales bacterium]
MAFRKFAFWAKTKFMHGATLLIAVVFMASSFERQALAEIDASLLAGMKARAIGPAATSGRIAAIDAVVGDPNTIYAGTATGGIWKTTNGGLTWKPIFDKE